MHQLLNRKIWGLLLILFAFVLPFGPAIPNIVVGLLGVFWLLHLVRGKLVVSKERIGIILIFTGYFLWYLLTFFYSENVDFFQRKLTMQGFLLFFPVLFFTMPYRLPKKTVYITLLGFSTSVAVLIFLSFLKQLPLYFEGPDSGLQALVGNNLSTALISIQYLSLSLYASFAVIACSYILFVDTSFRLKRKYKVIMILLIIFLSGALVILGGRTSIFVTALFLFAFALYSAVKHRNYVVPTLIIAAVVSGCALFLSNSETFEERWTEVYNFENEENPSDSYWGGTGMRLLIWDCAIKVISNDPMLGVGVGDEIDQLTLCYKVYMRNQLLVAGKTFHAHNIFLQAAVRAGLLGLFLFLLFVIYTSWMAKRKKNYLYLIFIATFVASGMTESFLQVNAGVLFLAFFSAFIYTNNTEALADSSDT
ncbi:O-antigen ligase family protein [Altibacter sp.]|uniref:O-antigen ligase family protein n=1 Tax=Altibacter sp. TaxID=2024823 RepID=UPI0025C61B2B|nr:O-antigen ligase family protein [Altibacter sp.]